MTADEFEQYLSETLGFRVERLTDAGGLDYTVVRGFEIRSGGLARKQCDVAIARSAQIPYVVPAAIHTKPPLVSMGSHSTQASPLGSDWQYWSRRYDHEVSPKLVWAHIVTVLSEDHLVEAT